MFGFLAEALRHFARQLIFGLVDDLVEWIRGRARRALGLDCAHDPQLLGTAEEVDADDEFVGTADEVDDDGPLQLPRAA